MYEKSYAYFELAYLFSYVDTYMRNARTGLANIW